MYFVRSRKTSQKLKAVIKTKIIPNPNETPTIIIAIHYIKREFFYPNQKKPIGRTTAPHIAEANRAFR
ncbi:hypothetical protein BTUL_0096g00370 [Botrytis tulipae]|uniref:Uncharacterized protein n=1 Tax=Botrytis tulipae TaxID=87230 RepID=A0A4Z1ELF1_9HELO|nr:hypothetical protein BTUL_0096g00370 [Botrytis tulipae]